MVLQQVWRFPCSIQYAQMVKSPTTFSAEMPYCQVDGNNCNVECSCLDYLLACDSSGGDCIRNVCTGKCAVTPIGYGVLIGVPLIIVILIIVIACCCCQCCRRAPAANVIYYEVPNESGRRQKKRKHNRSRGGELLNEEDDEEME